MRLRGDETLEADEGGAARSGHLDVGSVVFGAAQLKLLVDVRLHLVEVDKVGDVFLPELVERPHVFV